MDHFFDDLSPAVLGTLSSDYDIAKEACLEGCPNQEAWRQKTTVQVAIEGGLLDLTLSLQHSADPILFLEYGSYAMLLGSYVGQCEKVQQGAVPAGCFMVPPGLHERAIRAIMVYAYRGFDLGHNTLLIPTNVDALDHYEELWVYRRDDDETHDKFMSLTTLKYPSDEFHRLRGELCGIPPDIIDVNYGRCTRNHALDDLIVEEIHGTKET
jgi:hypothetical protein